MVLTPVTEKIFALMRSKKDFAKLSSEALEELASVAVYQQNKPGQEVWSAGDPCDYCVYVLDGLLEINRSSGTESDTVLGIFGPSDMIGISAILNKTNYPGSAKSLSESKIVKLYMRGLLSDKKLNTVNQEINAWLREMLIKHEQILRDKIDILSAGTVDDKLFELLKHLIRRFGAAEGPLGYRVSIALTKSKAAKLVGIRSETAIRLINDWQKKKMIEWNDHGILVHNIQLIERYVIQKHSED